MIDTFLPITLLIDETLRQFALHCDDCTTDLLYLSELSLALNRLPNSEISRSCLATICQAIVLLMYILESVVTVTAG